MSRSYIINALANTIERSGDNRLDRYMNVDVNFCPFIYGAWLKHILFHVT